MEEDTIVAISTAPGIGGIGIVRISGKESFNIIKRVFRAKNQLDEAEIKGYTMKYGKIVNPKNEEVIDEVLISFFKGPNSYTAENVCEINSHGGNIVVRKILNLCIENGARLAEARRIYEKSFYKWKN